MLKIKLVELFRHRNETTFRPYLAADRHFMDIGIQFVVEGSYDLQWVGQASFVDKTHHFNRAIKRGSWFLDNKIDGDYILFDGQDSASVIGLAEVMKRRKKPLAVLKNTLYVDRNDYTKPSIHGRKYWGSSSDYPDIALTDMRPVGLGVGDSHLIREYDYFTDLETVSKIKLSGSNWLSTVSPYWYSTFNKDMDVFAVFSYPAKHNTEFCRPTNYFYDRHRERCINWLNMLPKNIKVSKLENGEHIPIDQYYDRMKRAKIVVAPFGYGEMAPRDIEAAMVGAVLIKPDMSHIESIPNVYISDQTYRPCAWDFSNLNEKIMDTLDNYKYWAETTVNGMRNEFVKQHSPERLVEHVHGIISSLPGYTT